MLGILLWHVNLFAQDTSYLSTDAILNDLDKSLEILIAQQKISLRKKQEKSAWDLDKTQLGWMWGNYNSLKEDYGFEISQSFRFPTVYMHQKKLSQLQSRTAALELEERKLSMAVEIKNTSNNLLYLYEIRNIIQEQLDLLNESIQQQEEKFKSGVITELDVLILKSKKAELISEKTGISTEISRLEYRLGSLIGRQGRVSLSDKEYKIKLFKEDGLSVKHPKIVLQEQELQLVEQEIKLQKSNMLPDFEFTYQNTSLQGFYNINGQEIYYGTDKRFQSLQGTIAIPLFLGSYKSKIKQAKVQREIRSLELKQIELEWDNEYRQALKDYQNSLMLFENFEKEIKPLAKKSYEYAKEKMDTGAISFLDFKDEFFKYLEILKQEKEIIRKLNQSVIKLEYLSAKEIEK